MHQEVLGPDQILFLFIPQSVHLYVLGNVGALGEPEEPNRENAAIVSVGLPHGQFSLSHRVVF